VRAGSQKCTYNENAKACACVAPVHRGSRRSSVEEREQGNGIAKQCVPAGISEMDTLCLNCRLCETRKKYWQRPAQFV